MEIVSPSKYKTVVEQLKIRDKILSKVFGNFYCVMLFSNDVMKFLAQTKFVYETEIKMNERNNVFMLFCQRVSVLCLVLLYKSFS